MTEIPEHLLKRSKERRAAIGGEEAPAGDTAAPSEAVESAAPAAGAATPAVPAATAAAEVAPPPPPEPDRPEVAAAKARRRIPVWAMPVLLGLPLWAYVYNQTLEPAPVSELTPLEAGGELYGSVPCASCHGGGGAGSSSVPGFEEVLDTWPDFRDHMMWVRLGSAGWTEYASTYGATDKPVNGGMPGHPRLTDEDLAKVVLYERVEFGGMEESGEEYELLLAIANGETTFEEAGLGALSAAAGVDPASLQPG